MSAVDKIRDVTLDTLKNDCGDFSTLHWQAINSGSYYECVKIDEADEFDVMFICKVDCKIKPPPAKGQRIPNIYVVLEANKESAPRDLLFQNKWISPDAFYQSFHKAVLESFKKRELRSISLKVVPMTLDDVIGTDEFNVTR
ncbi:hypothetical protein LSAT2_018060 [Lamellibrachia satsuma]|nr:hypothetical protein LSAT2_018060 [Lamellibrachia satsuma]